MFNKLKVQDVKIPASDSEGYVPVYGEENAAMATVVNPRKPEQVLKVSCYKTSNGVFDGGVAPVTYMAVKMEHNDGQKKTEETIEVQTLDMASNSKSLQYSMVELRRKGKEYAPVCEAMKKMVEAFDKQEKAFEGEKSKHVVSPLGQKLLDFVKWRRE